MNITWLWRRGLYLSLWCVLAVPRGALAQDIDPVAAGIYEEAAALLEHLRREEDLVGAGLGVLWPGMAPWDYGSGWAEREMDRAFSERTLNAQHELVQLFTAVAVLQLVEANLVELDAPFTRYFPEFQPYAGTFPERFTVRQLLSHHGGLPAYYAPGSGRGAFNANGADEAWREVLAHDEELALVAAPGEVFDYSYLGYDLLGLLIERQSGEAYADYIARHILAPLNLSDTSFSADPASVPGIAQAYDDEEAVPHERLRDVPAAGLVSNVHDMGIFMQALLQGGQGILTVSSVEQLFQLQNASLYDDNLGFGLGFFLTPLGDELLLASHSAFNDGASSYVVALPRQGLGLVFTSNSEVNNVTLRAALDAFMARMIEAHNARPAPVYAPYPAAEADAQNLALGAGVFSGPGGIYRVEQRRGGLRIEAPFLPSWLRVNLLPRAEDYYGVELRLWGLNLGWLSRLEPIAQGLEGRPQILDGRRLWHWRLQGAAVVTLTELVPAQENAALD
ncbi:MAG: beta-lactamase family protein, partial [Pseudomonadales bacterium]|nr:beta-lactamase family protein [Pseudomonadales bacterium]